MTYVLLLASSLALLLAGGPHVPEGAWGGRDASLLVGAEGAEVEFSCAHGRIEEPLRLDKAGAFSARGYWVSEGGPQLEEEDRRPATYSGRSDGRTLTLRVKVQDLEQEFGPFTLALGKPPLLHKCD